MSHPSPLSPPDPVLGSNIPGLPAVLLAAPEAALGLNPLSPRFRNVIFDIVPCGEAGKFQVKAKFMGIDMEQFQLHYQVRIHHASCLSFPS